MKGTHGGVRCIEGEAREALTSWKFSTVGSACLGGVKRRRWSCRSPRDIQLRRGARLCCRRRGPAPLSPRVGAAMSGRGTRGCTELEEI